MTQVWAPPDPWENRFNVCVKCGAPHTDDNPIEEQYSYGYYYTVCCRNCAIASTSDHCGHRPEGMGNPQELDDYGNDGDY
jgi:hypothetical protein